MKATCIELVHLEGQTESQLGQKESKALRSVHQGVHRKANRLLDERNNHPLAVRIATIKDITNPFSHFNNPDGRTIQARILDAFYLHQRAEEEKNYLNEELMTLIVWSTNVAKTLTEQISIEDLGNTPGSRGIKTVLESRQIISCAGRALHPSQTIQQVIELYQNAVLAVAVEEDEEQSDGMDLLFEEILEDEAETLAEGNIEVGTYLDTEY